jgi:hypothetical protein
VYQEANPAGYATERTVRRRFDMTRGSLQRKPTCLAAAMMVLILLGSAGRMGAASGTAAMASGSTAEPAPSECSDFGCEP